MNIGVCLKLAIPLDFPKANSAQRREGLHIESPGSFQGDDNSAFTPGDEHHWGCGHFYEPDKFEGGIFMASNISKTSQVFDALVDKSAPNICDKHGGCEHLRKLLVGTGVKLDANELIWMTDCTPHESLAQEESGYRQFFRVVTSRVSHWFAQHSTPNCLVTLPDSVYVVDSNKFTPSS